MVVKQGARHVECEGIPDYRLSKRGFRSQVQFVGGISNEQINLAIGSFSLTVHAILLHFTSP